MPEEMITVTVRIHPKVHRMAKKYGLNMQRIMSNALADEAIRQRQMELFGNGLSTVNE